MESDRRAFREALKRETDTAVRQWARLMLRGEVPAKPRRRRRKAPAAKGE